jgi:hypothetical protein
LIYLLLGFNKYFTKMSSSSLSANRTEAARAVKAVEAAGTAKRTPKRIRRILPSKH